MKIHFKINDEIKLKKEFKLLASIDSIEVHDFHLKYDGSHELFANLLLPCMVEIYSNEYASLLEPIHYEPDDDRIHWNEDIVHYLLYRSTFEEFLEESKPGESIPFRFQIEREIVHKFRKGESANDLSREYGYRKVTNSIRYINRELKAMLDK